MGAAAHAAAAAGAAGPIHANSASAVLYIFALSDATFIHIPAIAIPCPIK